MEEYNKKQLYQEINVQDPYNYCSATNLNNAATNNELSYFEPILSSQFYLQHQSSSLSPSSSGMALLPPPVMATHPHPIYNYHLNYHLLNYYDPMTSTTAAATMMPELLLTSNNMNMNNMNNSLIMNNSNSSPTSSIIETSLLNKGSEASITLNSPPFSFNEKVASPEAISPIKMDLESTLHNNNINGVNDNQQQGNSKTKITRNKRKCTKPVCDLPFDCPKPGCNKTFKRSEHLKRHLNSVHNPIKSFICSYIDCGKAFSRSDNLNQHIRTHIRKMVAKK